MFRITAETCRAFTLAEVLILAAMNVETMHLTSAGRGSPASLATQKRTRSLSHFVRRNLHKAVEV